MKKPPGKRPRRVCCTRPLEAIARLNRIQALRLRAKGLTFRQIGQRLHRSHTTARKYILRSLYGNQ